MADASQTSFVDFGGIVPDHYRGEIAWLDVIPHLYWMSNSNYGIRFGQNAYNYGDEAYPIVFDTGTSLTLVPQTIWASFKA